MHRLKRDIERLAGVRFDDVDAVAGVLQAPLGAAKREGLRDERTAERGMLGVLAVRNISLRSAADNPKHATLSFDVAPPSIALEEVLWNDAVLYPPHPDAPDSRPYWSVQLKGTTVILGLASDHKTLTYVSISQR